MINILSYVGMNLQSEVCLWTTLGVVRTIFDATLFKVNANLKQVWLMSMPAELTMPVQSVLRTMISGIMLVQCFTVYVYLASYIVLLYPVFLEERPTLVLPWLLLAAIRKLLCELTSLAVGLGTCVLLGSAKPPCIKFVIIKISSIMPAFYLWMLVYSYYHILKMASTFKPFPVLHPPDNIEDCGLELAIRRRRTKSLFGEDHLRKKIVAGFYPDSTRSCKDTIGPLAETDKSKLPVQEKHSVTSTRTSQLEGDVLQPFSVVSHHHHDIGSCEDWFGSEIIIPRSDRILEQFIVMLMRIAVYLSKDGTESIKSEMFNTPLALAKWPPCETMEAMTADETDTPLLVGNTKGQKASYLREYPQIFMKKSENPQLDLIVSVNSLKNVRIINEINNTSSSDDDSEGLPSKREDGNPDTSNSPEQNILNKPTEEPKKIEQNHNSNDESSNKVNLQELKKQSSKSSEKTLNKLSLEKINIMKEEVLNKLEYINVDEIHQNFASSMASEELVLPHHQSSRVELSVANDKIMQTASEAQSNKSGSLTSEISKNGQKSRDVEIELTISTGVFSINNMEKPSTSKNNIDSSEKKKQE